MSRPKIVARYFERTEADVAQSALEAAGIPVYLADENMTRVAWLYTIALGGIRLFVPGERLDEARAVLAAKPGPEEQARDIGTPKATQATGACEACGSNDVDYTHRDRRLGSLSMLLLWFGLPFIAWGKRLRCNSCGNQWKPGRG